MCKKGLWFSLALALIVVAPVRAASSTTEVTIGEAPADGISQVTVQIGGRFCEYHREDVERALRRIPAVQQVAFLNDHGTVLVRYTTEGVHPAKLAEAAAGAAFGMACKAWVDRGGAEPTGSYAF